MSIQLEITDYKSSFVPTNPGVYVFRQRNTILYIGKASNLRRRVASYFRAHTSEKVQQLRCEATSLELISLQSEIEALLKEAELIKRHIPKFNVLMRDDKNYVYVAITDDPFPRIFVTHQPVAYNKRKRNQSHITSIGPYTSSISLKITLKLLRKFFPYCTCFAPHVRTCVSAQLGLCPGYCCTRANAQDNTEPSQKKYRTNIDAIIAVLMGRGKRITVNLKKRMRGYVATQNFEQAAMIRDQAIGIEDVIAHRLHLTKTSAKKKDIRMIWRTTEKNIIMALGTPAPISRVEGYDISHVSGANSTGSMVVFTNGMPDRDNYRMFKIKTVKGINDVDMLKEVIHRRLQHHEWQFPDLMVIDGGKPQLNAVMSIITVEAHSLNRRVVALAKREEELYSPHHAHTIRLDSLPIETEFFFQRIRDESHRFAKRYHHKLREMSYRPYKNYDSKNVV